MRVLFVSHTYVAPASQRKLDLIAQSGIGVGLITPSTWRPVEGLFAGQELHPSRGFEGISVIGVRPFRSGHIASYFFSPFSLLRAVRRFNPDLIHVEQEVYSLASAQLAIVARLLGKKLIVFGWENLDRRIPLIQRVSRMLVLRVAEALVCGNSDGARLARLWGFKRTIEVIPQLGVDLDEFHSPHRRGRGEVRIGFLGRIVPEKGVDVFLRALKVLAGDQVKFHALICGSGPAKTTLRGLAEELGLHEMLEWRDAVPHGSVPQILATLDILVLPSRVTAKWEEQFGLILVQAMAAGVAVVGSSTGAIPDVIGREDVLFPPEDHLSLAGVLRRLIEDDALRLELVEFGASRAKRLFSSEAIADRTVALYRSLEAVG